MNGIIRIFSPERRDIEGIKTVSEEYISANFKEYSKRVKISEYYTLEMCSIDFQEIFIVFDSRLLPKDAFRRASRETVGESLLRASFEGTKEVCDKKGIPYLIYEEELTKGDENLFKAKLDKVKDKIANRLKSII